MHHNSASGASFPSPVCDFEQKEIDDASIYRLPEDFDGDAHMIIGAPFDHQGHSFTVTAIEGAAGTVTSINDANWCYH